MKVFLDTNVIIDFFQGRAGKNQAGAVLQMGLDGTVDLCLTDLTLVNFFYICRKGTTHEQRLRFIAYLRTFIAVLPIDQNAIDRAVAMNPKDFEDCVQYQAAIAGKADVIITSNTKDFAQFGAITHTSEEFLEMMGVTC